MKLVVVDAAAELEVAIVVELALIVVFPVLAERGTLLLGPLLLLEPTLLLPIPETLPETDEPRIFNGCSEGRRVLPVRNALTSLDLAPKINVFLTNWSH